MEVLIILIVAPFGILLLARFYNKAVADFSHDKKKRSKANKRDKYYKKATKDYKNVVVKGGKFTLGWLILTGIGILAVFAVTGLFVK